MKHKYLILLPLLSVLLASCANLVQAPAGEQYCDGVYYNATTLAKTVPDYIPARRPIADTVVVVNNYYSPVGFALAGFTIGAWSSFWWSPWHFDPWFWDPWYYDPWYRPWGPWYGPWYRPYYDPWYRPWGPWYGPGYYYRVPTRRNPVYGSGYTPVTHSGGLGSIDRTRGRSVGYGGTRSGSGTTTSGTYSNGVLHPQRVGGGTGTGTYTTPARTTVIRSGSNGSSRSSGTTRSSSYSTPSRSSYSTPSRSSGSSSRGSYSAPSRSYGGGFSGGGYGGGRSGGASHGRR